jgi:hypothetical protein
MFGPCSDHVRTPLPRSCHLITLRLRGPNMVRTWSEHGSNMVRTWFEHGSNMVRTWYYRGYARAHFGHILGTFWARCARLEQNINRAEIARTKRPPGRRTRAVRFGPHWRRFCALRFSHRFFAPLLQALFVHPNFHTPPRRVRSCNTHHPLLGLHFLQQHRAASHSGSSGSHNLAAGRGVKIWVHKQGSVGEAQRGGVNNVAPRTAASAARSARRATAAREGAWFERSRPD